jgi:hypothetical protein
MAENWHIRIEDSEITFINKLLTSSDVEAKVESDLKNFLLSIGIGAKRISEKPLRTPDYKYMDTAFEATIIHPYFPRISEIEKTIADLQNNLGNCYHAYLYSDSNKSNMFKMLFKEKCDPSCSILCLRQHVSVYRNKIINKIEDKSYQSEDYPAHVLFLDFRTAPFDSVSLSKEICAILQDVGEQYPSLVGIVFGIPKEIASSIIQEPVYHYISNPRSKFINSDISDKLKLISRPSTSDLTQMMIPIIIYRSGIGFLAKNLCVNGPTIKELYNLGLPVLSGYTFKDELIEHSNGGTQLWRSVVRPRI